MKIDRDMLISSILFSENEKGRLVVLSVVEIGALDIPTQTQTTATVSKGWAQ